MKTVVCRREHTILSSTWMAPALYALKSCVTTGSFALRGFSTLEFRVMLTFTTVCALEGVVVRSATREAV